MLSDHDANKCCGECHQEKCDCIFNLQTEVPTGEYVNFNFTIAGERHTAVLYIKPEDDISIIDDHLAINKQKLIKLETIQEPPADARFVW